LPCKFDYLEQDLITYYMINNMSLGVANVFTNLASNMRKDNNLLALKVGMDNAILQYRA